MRRLWLIRHGPTSATRDRRFGLDEPLLPEAIAPAGQLGARLAARVADDARALTSPALRCRETALALGLEPAIDLGLDQLDIGLWRGRSWAGVEADAPGQLAAWRTDPRAAPHGGECLAAYGARAADWLERRRAEPAGAVVAVTHSELIRVLVLYVLGLPLDRLWTVAVDLLSVTELQLAGDGWTVSRLNAEV